VQFNRTLSWLKYTDNRHGLIPDTRSLKDAHSLAETHRESKSTQTLSAMLFSNAASVDSSYADAARRHLDAAESLGTHPLHTYRWRLKFDPQTPAPTPLAPGRSLPPLELRWRLIALPPTPRYHEFLKWLEADRRLD
jgi:hypothetical protein